LPETERRPFLAQACGDDAAMCDEVAALIASAPTAGASLRSAVVAEVRMLASDVATAQVGRRIAVFRLTRLIGEGGMGAVYLGERDDAEFAQRVAVKILRHAVGSPALVARFRD